MYKTDVFVGQRSDKDQGIVLAESYVRSMRECADLTELQFFSRFGELSRAIPYIPGSSDEAAGKVFELYARNGRQVKKAITNAVKHYADQIGNKDLADRCLMRQLFGPKIPDGKPHKGKKGGRSTKSAGASRKAKNLRQQELLILHAALMKHHGVSDEEVKWEPATQKQLHKLTGWNQPKISRMMKVMFGDNPMQTYKRRCKEQTIQGFLLKRDDGRYDVEAYASSSDE